jgi:hypothetical protein
MAIRPLFIPKYDSVGVTEKQIDFQWFPGLSASQKKKSIEALHSVVRQIGFERVLEISSKSENELGINLSAFNLKIKTKKYKKEFTVETAFQGSKVFERGGPYKDLFGLDSRSAKKDIRLKESGNLVEFEFFGRKFPLVPRTYFYDWIYINALDQNVTLSDDIKYFQCFTDIEFNPKKSINCQAHAVSLYLSLNHLNLLEEALESPESFLKITEGHYKKQQRNIGVQNSIL